MDFELRGDLEVLGGRKESVGVEGTVILAFVGGETVNEIKLRSNKVGPGHILV
jgi:hypothetical protein